MHFVLDQTFPVQGTGLPWPSTLRLSLLQDILPGMEGGHDDWELLLALDKRGDIDGFIANDAKMLYLPPLAAPRPARLSQLSRTVHLVAYAPA